MDVARIGFHNLFDRRCVKEKTKYEEAIGIDTGHRFSLFQRNG